MKQNKTTQNVPPERDNPTPSLHTALQLARMYGVAESLDPIPFLPMEEFISLIKSWTAEYQSLPDPDILAFFEGKMKQKGAVSPPVKDGALTRAAPGKHTL